MLDMTSYIMGTEVGGGGGSGGAVDDVKVNGTSVVSDGVANVPVMGADTLGVAKLGVSDGLYGLTITAPAYTNTLMVEPANDSHIKAGTGTRRPISSAKADVATFYGLAKAAGDATQSQSANAVGTYTDNAKAAIQHMLGTDANFADYESDATADQAYAIGELFMLNGKLHQATAAIAIGDTFTVGTNCAVVNAADVFPHDVQVDGTSVVTDGVANVPVAASDTLGVIQVSTNGFYGLTLDNGKIKIAKANNSDIKGNWGDYKPITPSIQDRSTFYGLAKAAGDSTQSESNNTIGTYTETAKSKIHDMLDAPETVSGSTPSITAQPGVRYICGEVSTLAITVPATGIIDVVFTSGSTPTVLTVTPPSGVTAIKWANGFDPTSLDADTVYEINIADGQYGVVASWT